MVDIVGVKAGASLELDGVTLRDGIGFASSGGAIFNEGGTVTVTASTFSGSADFGGAIHNNNFGTVNLASSILVNSPSGDNCFNDDGSITSQDSNLSDDASCNLIVPGDQPNTDPQLGPLADNGGPTETILPVSLAIDAALSCATATDQRGIARPQGPARSTAKAVQPARSRSSSSIGASASTRRPVCCSSCSGAPATHRASHTRCPTTATC
jgi:hypothetical protein